MGSEDGGVLLGGGFSPHNSLLNRALDCCARRWHPKWEEGGIGEEVSLGRVFGYKRQGLRDSTRPLDGCGREKGARTVAASDRRGKILTLNRECKEDAKSI